MLVPRDVSVKFGNNGINVVRWSLHSNSHENNFQVGAAHALVTTQRDSVFLVLEGILDALK
jgi:hypothetical protein